MSTKSQEPNFISKLSQTSNSVSGFFFDDQNNDTSSGSQDNDTGAQLLLAAEEGRVDVVRQILENDGDMVLVGDSIGDTALHMSVKARHGDVVLELIRIATIHGQLEKAMVDQNIDGDTALHLAIKNGNQEAARCLIAVCDPDGLGDSPFFVANRDGKYPADLAIQYGCIELMPSLWAGEGLLRLLNGSFQYSIDVDLQMELKRRALEAEDEYTTNWRKLCTAVRRNQEREVMRILGEKPSLMQNVDSVQGTLFHVAAKAGEVRMIRKLVQYIITNNVKPHNEVTRFMSERNETGDNPLHKAVECGKMPAAFYLSEVAPQAVYKVNDKGISPLYLAVEKGHEELLSFMINRIEVSMSIKQSLLSHAIKASLPHAAIKAKNIGILQVLLEKLPCLIDSSDIKGWKPLSYAASKGYLDQVSFLLTNFPDSVKKRDRDGSMPIHKAIAGGHIDIVTEIIAKCPQSLYHIDMKGRTTLHIATRYRKQDILSYLLKEKDVKKLFNFRDNEDKTFEDLMIELKNCKV